MKKLSLFVASVLCLVIAANACEYYYPVQIKESQWTGDGYTHYYKVFQYQPAKTDLNKNWETARDFNFTQYDQVKTTGWTLATVTSQAEQNNLTSMMTGINGEYWLGGFQPATTNGTDPKAGWQWITGEAWGYTNWYTDEPNDWDHHIERYLGTWSADGWKWNDEFNGTGNICGFIAERRVPVSVPEPGTLSMLLLGGIFVIGAAVRKRKS
jgi:hypothetical protein